MQKNKIEISEIYPNKKEAMNAAKIYEKNKKGVISWTVRPFEKPADINKPWILEFKYDQ